MRAVSWIVVLASLAFLLSGNLAWLEERMRAVDTPEDAVSGTAARMTSKLSWRDIKRISREYTEAWNQRDPVAIAERFAPDARMVINGDTTHEGASDLRAMAAEFISELPDLTMTMNRLERDGDRIVYHWTVEGTHAGTGRPVRVSGTESWLLGADGRIIESRETWDEAAWLAQIGEN